MGTKAHRRRLRPPLATILLLVAAGTLGGCVWDPYTGTWVCCGYRPYPYWYRPYPPAGYYPPPQAPSYYPPPQAPTAAPH